MNERRPRHEPRIQALERELAECRAGILVRAQELECAKAALEGQARTWQSIIDSIADGVVVADEGGALLCMNPAARRLLGEGPAPPPRGARSRGRAAANPWTTSSSSSAATTGRARASR